MNDTKYLILIVFRRVASFVFGRWELIRVWRRRCRRCGSASFQFHISFIVHWSHMSCVARTIFPLQLSSSIDEWARTRFSLKTLFKRQMKNRQHFDFVLIKIVVSIHLHEWITRVAFGRFALQSMKKNSQFVFSSFLPLNGDGSEMNSHMQSEMIESVNRSWTRWHTSETANRMSHIACSDRKAHMHSKVERKVKRRGVWAAKRRRQTTFNSFVFTMVDATKKGRRKVDTEKYYFVETSQFSLSAERTWFSYEQRKWFEYVINLRM